MASADFSLHRRASQRSAGVAPSGDNKARSPRVRRVTFAPSTRRIYFRSVRVAFGLQVFTPPRPPRGCLLCGSCSSGQSFASGFLPASPREATVAVQLGVPSHQGPQGTLTPKSLPARLSPRGCSRLSAGRAMPGARKKRAESEDSALGARGEGRSRRRRRSQGSPFLR